MYNIYNPHLHYKDYFRNIFGEHVKKMLMSIIGIAIHIYIWLSEGIGIHVCIIITYCIQRGYDFRHKPS